MIKIMKNLFLCSLLFNLVLCDDADNQEFIPQEHVQYYKILELPVEATLQEVEDAYYIQTALCHKNLKDYRPYSIKTDTYGNCIELYGRFGEIHYGNYYKWDFIPSNSTRNSLSELKKKLNDIRHAYEVITGNVLDKVRLKYKCLDTYKLNQEILYHEIDKRGITNLQEYINQQRFMNNVEPLLADDQPEYFVFGELYQNESLLADHYKAKASHCLPIEKQAAIKVLIEDYEYKKACEVLKGLTIVGFSLVGGYWIFKSVPYWYHSYYSSL